MIKKQRKSVKKILVRKQINYISNPILYILGVIVCVGVTVLGTYYVQHKKIEKTDGSIPVNYSLFRSIPTPTVMLPDFSNEEVKPRTQFDVSTWQTFINSEIGFQFKYPPEWGKPVIRNDTCNNPKSCSSDDKYAYAFYLSFPTSGFSVGGGSKNLSPPRGTNILHDFNGFDNWYKPERLCDTPWFIYCQKTDNKVDYVTVPACGGEPGSGFGFERVLLINLPNNKINGLAFGGNFIPNDQRGLFPMNSCEAQVKKIVGTSLLSRKLNSDIMSSFDLFEKVFETIQIN